MRENNNNNNNNKNNNNNTISFFPAIWNQLKFHDVNPWRNANGFFISTLVDDEIFRMESVQTDFYEYRWILNTKKKIINK